MIHWWPSATCSFTCVSEQVTFRRTKQFGDIISPSCNFLLLLLKCQYPVIFLAWDPIERELFLHSSQPWGKVIIDLVVAFSTSRNKLRCRCFCCLGWLRFHCCGCSTIKQIIIQTQDSCVLAFDIKICISYYWLTSMTVEGYWWNKNGHIITRRVAMEERGLVRLVFYEILQMQYALPAHRYYCQAAYLLFKVNVGLQAPCYYQFLLDDNLVIFLLVFTYYQPNNTGFWKWPVPFTFSNLLKGKTFVTE